MGKEASIRPFDWIRVIESSLSALDEQPQFGAPSPFPWETFSDQIKQLFETSDFSLSHKELGWTETDKVFEGIGDNTYRIPVIFAPLTQPLYGLMSEGALKTLMQKLLGPGIEEHFFLDESYVQSFFRFLVLEALSKIDHLQFTQGLVAQVGAVTHNDHISDAGDPCFVIDYALNFGDQPIGGRLLLPPAFRDGWKKHFAAHDRVQHLEKLKHTLPLEVALEIGSSELSIAQWKSVHKGDVILLDRCLFDPDTHKGRVVFTVEGKPLMRGKVKAEGVLLVEYPNYEEVTQSMDDELTPEEGLEDNLYDDLQAEEFAESDEEPSIFDEEEPKIEEEAAPETPEEEEEAVDKISVEKVSEAAEPFAVEKLPLQLTVEVARIRMTAEELMNLSPGNLLDLNVAPEHGVDLVLSGKKVGKGELVRVGEVLGVRVIEL